MDPKLGNDHGGLAQRNSYCHILKIGRDNANQIRIDPDDLAQRNGCRRILKICRDFDQFRIDPDEGIHYDERLSQTELTNRLAEYLGDRSSLVWVHLYGNDLDIFRVLYIRPYPITKSNPRKTLLDLFETTTREELRDKFHKIHDASQQADNPGNRYSRNVKFRIYSSVDSSGVGSVAFMPVAQYQCLDQNQEPADVETVAEIARQLQSGTFRVLPIEDQMWAVHGQNLVLTSAPYPRKHDVFYRLLKDICKKRIPSHTLPLRSARLFCLVLSQCIRNQSEFIDASQIIVKKASTDRATAFNDLHTLLERLPEPEQETYNNRLREVIDKLIRIQREIRWINVLSSISRNLDIYASFSMGWDTRKSLRGDSPSASSESCFEDWDHIKFKLGTWCRTMNKQRKDMNQLLDQTLRVKDEINQLFQFKQSLSNVLSTQVQLRQTEESARSGNVIMYFTMMTILFSSLSFMATFFALNIRSFPRNDQGDVELSMSYVTSRIVAWSIAIAAPFWLLAAFLNPVTDLLHKLLPSWLSPQAPSNTGNPQTQGGNGNVA